MKRSNKYPLPKHPLNLKITSSGIRYLLGPQTVMEWIDFQEQKYGKDSNLMISYLKRKILKSLETKGIKHKPFRWVIRDTKRNNPLTA